jgi:hypothetical protein
MGGVRMNEFEPPSSCPKCGGDMEEGFTVDNSKGSTILAGYKAYGKDVRLGGSSSWWKIVTPEENTSAGLLGGDAFLVDRVLAGEPIQVFTFRCLECGYLESYAPLFR